MQVIYLMTTHLRSLFASFFGNIVGALFVALPASYMYLSDYGASGYRKAENGEATSSSGSSTTEVKQTEKKP
jgi:formate/nitrite transporter FocA (FNT family)